MSEKKSSWFKPSLDWLLIFVPISIALRFIPALENPTVLFICACLAIIPLAGWMGKATEHLAEHLGQGIGGLLNATFGNAAEHSSAILMAMRNKMDLSLGIALGSNLQIALFVAPILIFASYLFGKKMNLEFMIPEVVAVFGSILIVQQICSTVKATGSKVCSFWRFTRFSEFCFSICRTRITARPKLWAAQLRRINEVIFPVRNFGAE